MPTKIPNLEEWDKSQSGNLVGNSLVGTCLTLPNLGFLWDFFNYPKNIQYWESVIFSCDTYLTKLLFKGTFPHSGRIWYYYTTMSTKDQICFFLIVHDLKETKQLLYLIPNLQRQFVFSLHTQLQLIDIQPVPVLYQW